MTARKPKPADIAAAIRADIMAGRLAPGAALIQDDLARRCGVSRIPVREALRRLEAEGMIDVTYGGGTAVHRPDRDEISEVFEMRLQLEPHVLRLSLGRLGPRDFEAAEAAIGLLGAPGDAVSPGNKVLTNDVSVGEVERRFHDAIYAGADRPLHLATIRRLQARVAGLFAVRMTPEARMAYGSDLATLLEVVRGGDEKDSSGRLVRQLIRSREGLLAGI